MLVFARVVEESSFSAAARRLGQSKSAVSKQVAQLEDVVGARLLQRTTRRLALTDAGTAFYERCARIATEVEDAENAVSQLQTQPRGRLRVSGPLSFGIRYLGPVIADFLRIHEELHIELDLSDRRVDLLEEGFDVAVRIGRLGDSSLIARRLCPIKMHLVAAPTYLAKHGRPNHPSELVDHNCLQYTYSSAGPTWTFAMPDGPLAVATRGDLRSNNGDVVLAAVQAGLGIAMSPDFICGPSLHSGELVTLFDGYTETGSYLSAVYPHGRHLSTKVRLFIDALVAAFQDPPWLKCCSTADKPAPG
ncbi:MAG: LysR family transcriptional regulator [Deltaproteobacteria bacterium]|nr:LysR family transcriptional regulator [Deltaproteobacteria bacterium]